MCLIVIRPPSDTLETREEKYPPPATPLQGSNIVLIFDSDIYHRQITFFNDDFMSPDANTATHKETFAGIYSTRKLFAEYYLINTTLILIKDETSNATNKFPPDAVSERTQETIVKTKSSETLSSETEAGIITAIKNAAQEGLFDGNYSFIYLTSKNKNIKKYMTSNIIDINHKKYVISTVHLNLELANPFFVEYNSQISTAMLDIHDLFTIANSFTLNLITDEEKIVFFREKLRLFAVNLLEDFTRRRFNTRDDYAAFMLLINYIKRRDKKESVDFNEKFEEIYSDLETDLDASKKEHQKKPINCKKIIKKILLLIACIIIGVILGFFTAYLMCLMLTAFISACLIAKITLSASTVGGAVTGYCGFRFFNKKPCGNLWQKAMDYGLKN